MCNAYNTLNNKLKITSHTTQQYWFLEYCFSITLYVRLYYLVWLKLL